MSADVEVALPTGRFVELQGRGVTFVREVPGPVGAPTIVLLHGWTATADLNWFRTFDAFGRRYRVLAMDLRGHGRGIRPRAYFRLEHCADDVIALADAFGIEQVIPVGYSMGGAVAQLVAQRHQTRVAGLVLCSTAASFRSNARAERVMWNGVMPAVAAALTLTPNMMRQQLLSRYLLVRSDAGTPTWMLDEMRRNDPAMIAQAGAALGRFDSRQWIGTLGVPTSVVVTTRDATVATPRQRKLAALIPDASVFDVDADHRAAVTDAPVWTPAALRAIAAVT